MAYFERHGNISRPSKGLRAKYGVLTEAAWHVLMPFVDERDFNTDYPERDGATGEVVLNAEGGVVTQRKPMNVNEHWQYALAKTEVMRGSDGRMIPAGEDDLFDGDTPVGRCRLTTVTKKHVDEHLRGVIDPDTGRPRVLYYRSKHDAKFRLGYGRRPKQPKLANVAYAKLLGVPQGVVSSDRVNALLLTLDIDFKPERYPEGTANDAPAVRDWLVSSYFPHAYSEPSTSGNGVHLYLKVAYDGGGDHGKTLACVIRQIKDFQRHVDAERENLGFVADIDRAVCGVPSCVGFGVDGTVKVTRSQCVKLPMFLKGHNLFRRLRAVQRFQWAPVFLMPAFLTPAEEAVEIGNAPQALAAAPTHSAASLLSLIDVLTPPTGASPHTEADDLCQHWEQVGNEGWRWKRARPSKTEEGKANTPPRSVEAELAKIREVGDAKERCRRFYCEMNRQHNTVVSPDEIDALYVQHGFNRTDDSVRRKALWNSIHEYLKPRFRPSRKRMPSLAGFADVRDALTRQVESQIDCSGLGYTKAKGKGVKAWKKVTAEDLAAIYYCVRTVFDLHGTAFLSYEDAAAVHKELLGRAASPNKIGCIVKALLDAKWMSVGEKGNWAERRATVYRPAVPLPPASRALTATGGGGAADVNASTRQAG